jgi:hypothetical protein
MNQILKKPLSDNTTTTLSSLERRHSVTHSPTVSREEHENSYTQPEHRNRTPHINDFYTFCNACGVDTTIFSHETHCSTLTN